MVNEQNHSNDNSKPLKSFVDALFRLEKAQSIEAVKKIVISLIELFKQKKRTGLNKAFAYWIKESLIPTRFPDAHIPEIATLEEVNSMLYENAQSWYDAEREKGKRDGKKEGIEEEKSNVVLRTYKMITKNLDTLATIAALKKEDVKRILKQASVL